MTSSVEQAALARYTQDSASTSIEVHAAGSLAVP
jgi:hypothetical protein